MERFTPTKNQATPRSMTPAYYKEHFFYVYRGIETNERWRHPLQFDISKVLRLINTVDSDADLSAEAAAETLAVLREILEHLKTLKRRWNEEDVTPKLKKDSQ